MRNFHSRQESGRGTVETAGLRSVAGFTLLVVGLLAVSAASLVLARAVAPTPFAWLPLGVAAGLVLRFGWKVAIPGGIATGPWLLGLHEPLLDSLPPTTIVIAMLALGGTTSLGLLLLRFVMGRAGREISRGLVTLPDGIRLILVGIPVTVIPILATWLAIENRSGGDGAESSMNFALTQMLGLFSALPITLTLLPGGSGCFTYRCHSDRLVRVAPGVMLLIGTVVASWWAPADPTRAVHLAFGTAAVISVMWLATHSGWFAASMATLMLSFVDAQDAFGNTAMLLPLMGFLIMFAASMEQRFREIAVVSDKHLELESLLGATGAAMLELDREGKVLFRNDAATRLTEHLDPADGKGMIFLDAFDDRSRRLIRAATSVALSGRRRECEVSIRSSEGPRIMCLAVCTPLHDADQRVRGCSIVLLDLTSTRRREMSRRRRQEHEFESLANALVHDVNNFAMAVGGAVSLAREESGDRLGDVLENIENSCIETARRTQRIKHVVPHRQQPRLVDLGRITSERLRRHHRQGRISIATITCDPGTVVDVPESFADFIVDEFISNAIDAQATKCPEIALSCREVDGGEVELKIGDNGPGIPPNVQERIGTTFVTTKGGGRGLGLRAITSSVRAAGGRLRIDSSPRGTVLFITLPLTPSGERRPSVVIVSSPREFLRTPA